MSCKLTASIFGTIIFLSLMGITLPAAPCFLYLIFSAQCLKFSQGPGSSIASHARPSPMPRQHRRRQAPAAGGCQAAPAPAPCAAQELSHPHGLGTQHSKHVRWSCSPGCENLRFEPPLQWVAEETRGSSAPSSTRPDSAPGPAPKMLGSSWPCLELWTSVACSQITKRKKKRFFLQQQQRQFNQMSLPEIFSKSLSEAPQPNCTTLHPEPVTWRGSPLCHCSLGGDGLGHGRCGAAWPQLPPQALPPRVHSSAELQVLRGLHQVQAEPLQCNAFPSHLIYLGCVLG